MNIWEFLQETNIKAFGMEFSGFGASIICLTLATLILRIGLSAGPAVLRRFFTPKDDD